MCLVYFGLKRCCWLVLFGSLGLLSPYIRKYVASETCSVGQVLRLAAKHRLSSANGHLALKPTVPSSHSGPKRVAQGRFFRLET